jgi:hypothetical protein
VTNPGDRPQPVLDWAKLAAAIGGLVTASGAALVFVGWATDTQVRQAAILAAGAVTAVGALVAVVAPLWAARRARALVTPLKDPRDNSGQQLLTADQWAASWGKHGSSGITASNLWAIPGGTATATFRTATTGDRSGTVTRGFRSTDASDAPAGMHAHPTKKLGKRPPIPGRAAVPFRDFVKAVPAHPVVDVAPDLVWPMDRNDQAGDCVVAGLDHALQTICALLGEPRRNWNDAELLELYQTQNPGFRAWSDAGGPDDGGMVIQTFLEHLVATGAILAFGRVDHDDPEEMRAATYLGLAIVTGEVLDVAQQQQTIWDWQRSPEWGGHCTCTVGYPDSTRQTCITWGQKVDMTEAFVAHQVDEAWFVLTQAHVDHAAFRDHFDLPAFAAAVAQITDGKVVVPIPAPPSPAPPAPLPPADVDAWAARSSARSWLPKRDRQAAQDYLTWRAQQKGPSQ